MTTTTDKLTGPKGSNDGKRAAGLIPMIGKAARVLLQPAARARALRGDDSAQALLLTGFMVFLLVVFMIFAMNASQSVYRKIQNQNAADAAADAAALWQARGINMLQGLVNAHYVMNMALILPMLSTCKHCLDSWDPCGDCMSLEFWRCDDCDDELDKCDDCHDLDNAQEDMARSIYTAEAAAIKLASREIFIEANRYAKENNASPFFQAGMTYTNFAAYQDIKGLFPIHNFLKDCFRPNVEAFNPQLMYEKFRGSANIPGKVVGEPLHAVLVWGSSYDVPWSQMIMTPGPDYTSSKGGLLGYVTAYPGDNERPWEFGRHNFMGYNFMQWFSLPFFIWPLGECYGKGGLFDCAAADGWSDHYWKNAGTPTMTWMTAVSNQVGGVLRFGQVNASGEYAGEMFHFLSPRPNPEISLAPLMAAASSTSEGKIEATNLKELGKSIPGALKSKNLKGISGAGKAQAKGTLVPVEISGPWWGSLPGPGARAKAQDMGILH